MSSTKYTKRYVSHTGPVPLFEGYIDPNSPAGELQGYANIAGAFHDRRDPVRRAYARIMFAILVSPFVMSAIYGLYVLIHSAI